MRKLNFLSKIIFHRNSFLLKDEVKGGLGLVEMYHQKKRRKGERGGEREGKGREEGG